MARYIAIYKFVREIRSPGCCNPVSGTQVHPKERVIQNGRICRFDLRGAQIDTEAVIHYESANVIERHPVHEDILGTELERLSECRGAMKDIAVVEHYRLGLARAP